MKKLVTVAFACIWIGVCGQDAKLDKLDYAVSQKGDTVYGLVQILTYDLIDRIEVTAGRDRKSFTAIQVKELSIKKETYRPVRTETGYFMMKLVKPGFLSLYLAHQPKASVFEIPYLVKISGQSLEVPNLGFKKYMSEFLEECFTVKERVKKGELGRREVDKIVDEFNLCTAKPDTKPATVVAETSTDPRLPALDSLKSKLEKDESLAVRKDALDILQDVTEKVKKSQAVPNYLLEGLKSQLKDAPAYQQDLENILAMFKTQ